MTRIVWDVGAFEHGVDRAVLYSRSNPAVAWNGLVLVSENSPGGEVRQYFADGVQFLTVVNDEEYKAKIDAFVYPDEFEDILDNQSLPQFDLCYRTLTDSGYKIHLVYNASVTRPSRDISTLGSSVEPSTFTWDISTVPTDVPGVKPTSHLVIDTSYAYPELIAALEDVLYGSDAADAHFPTVQELLDLFDEYAYLQIINHGDGTWTAIGPDEAVHMLDATTFEIIWPSVVYISPDTYTVSTF